MEDLADKWVDGGKVGLEEMLWVALAQEGLGGVFADGGEGGGRWRGHDDESGGGGFWGFRWPVDYGHLKVCFFAAYYGCYRFVAT